MKTIFEVEDLRRLRSCVRKSLLDLGIMVPKLTKNSSSRKSKRLQSKGKDKGQAPSSIFGLPLSDIPSDFIEGCGYVPRFLVDSVNFIDVNIDTIGLFRKTGSVHRQKELKRIIENGGSVKCAKLVDDVANLVKQFFRELPESLITSTLEGHFMKALEIDDESTKIRAILFLCLLLPLDHLGTLRYFTLLLSRIVLHKHENKMDCTNLALVITPNILGSCNEKSLHCNERHLSVQTSLVELMIQSAQHIGTVTPDLEEMMATEVEPSFEASDSEASFDKSQRKKRRSGSLQGMMSSIEQNLRSWRSGKKASMESSYTSNQSNLTTHSSDTDISHGPELKTPVLRKRKAEEDPLGLSKKKMRTIMKGLPQQSLLGGQSFDVSSMSASFKGNATFPTSLSMSEALNRDKDESAFVFTSASFQETSSKRRFPSPFRNKRRSSPKLNVSGKKKNKLFRMLSVNHDNSKAKQVRQSRKHGKTNSSPGRVLDEQKLAPEPGPDDMDVSDKEGVYIIDDKSDISSLAENLEFDLYDQVSMTSPDVSIEGSRMHSRTSVRSQAEQGTPTKTLLRRGRPNTPTNGLHPSLKKKYCHDDDPIVAVDSKTIDELNSHVEVIVCNALQDGTNTWASASGSGSEMDSEVG